MIEKLIPSIASPQGRKLLRNLARKYDWRTRQTDFHEPSAADQQAEIRRLSEQRRALREVERLMRNGRPVPPLLREKALGK